MKTVDFIICGTQKGGTTALDTYLREHPEICMADRKEVHFFDNEVFFSNGKPDYSLYHSLFSPKATHRIMGEATPIYMYWYEVPKRIWEYNPNIKLIVMLRNPIDRAYSHWNMERSRKTDSFSFLEAVLKERQRCREALPQQHRVYSYVDRGFYLEQLRRLWTFFPKDSVLIMKNEYLKEKPNEALKDICLFLGVSQYRYIQHKDVHSRPYDSNISDEEIELLRFIFEFEIKELERELNWDCSYWLSG